MNDVSAAGQFLYALVCLTAVLHPAGLALGFAVDLQRETPATRAWLAWRACVVAGVALLCMGGVGGALCALLGIGADSVRIGCGGMLALAAADQALLRVARAGTGTAPGVVSLGLLLVGGPGVTAAALLLVVRSRAEPALVGASVAAAGTVLALTLLALLRARYVVRRLGPVGVVAVGRAMAAMLAILAAEEVLRGLRALTAP